MKFIRLQNLNKLLIFISNSNYMNWISRKDNQINLKRKHSNINALHQIACNNYQNVFKPNKFDKNQIGNQLKPIIENEPTNYKIISKILY